jgi:hypothetical protein
MTDPTWWDCCVPQVCHGSRRDGRDLVVLVHAVGCDEPVHRHPQRGPRAHAHEHAQACRCPT